MAVEDALVTKLLATAPITNLIGAGSAARLYPCEAPQLPSQTTPNFPRILYEVVGEYRPKTLCGSSGLVKASFVVDCDGGDGAQGYKDAKTLAEAVRQLDGIRGQIGSVFVNKWTVEDHRDEPDEPRHAKERGVQRVSLDVVVWFNESIPVTV